MTRYDYVIFGATGFTGEFVVEELAKTANGKSWAVSARNESKLKGVLTRVGTRIGEDLSHIPLIIADVGDEDSLVAMAKQARLVLNVVGPYRFYGENVVKACVENGASHVDISGEPIYLEATQLNFNETAKKNGVYVVGSCGFDSIPIEAGLQYMKQNLDGDLNDVETFVELKSGDKGSKVNFGTFHSMIYGIANAKDLKPIRKALFPTRLPRSSFKPPQRKPLFYHEGVEGWCLPFLGSDKSVVYRSSMYDYTVRHQRPAAVNTYLRIGSLPMALALIFWGIMFYAMASFEATRKLLEKYPELFTFGMFSKDGPTREQLKETSFSYFFFGRGWKDTMADVDQQHENKPDTDIVARVDGPDPGYVATATFMVTCARIILEQPEKLPKGGGVFAPGSLFQETNWIDRLEQRGIKFTLVSPASPIN